MLSVKNREWCLFDIRDFIEISLLIVRYICSFGIVVVGLKAPGITSNGYKNLKNDGDGDKDDKDDKVRISNGIRYRNEVF